ncbi:NADP-dependent oxidoreductase domain-containing protein [Mrakia frigida]|uniref:aldo/keto reductase n=1 Tax=Mrakia frigida TaxID=29902 RepID=UPI003FCC2528
MNSILREVLSLDAEELNKKEERGLLQPSSSTTEPSSILAFGTGTAIYGKDATSQVVQAIKSGFVHIDAAESYANEETVGKAIIESGVPREKLFITSKSNSNDVRNSLQDLYLIHSPENRDVAKLWLQLEELKAEGLVKSIGVSNFRVTDFEKVLAVAKVIPSINQIEFHPYLLKSALPLLALQAKHNIKVASYGPLTSIFRAPGGEVDAVVKTIAEKKGATEGNVLLRWALQRGGGEVVTTSTKAERLKEQLTTLNFELSEEEMKAIDEAGSTQHYRHFQKFLDEPEK